VRTAIGPVQLGNLKAGTVRDLTRGELAELHALVDTDQSSDKSTK
jgi:23S rRNA pseudouridine2605 synthase